MRDELFSICRQQKARIKLHIRRTYSMNPELKYWQRLPSKMMYHFSVDVFFLIAGRNLRDRHSLQMWGKLIEKDSGDRERLSSSSSCRTSFSDRARIPARMIHRAEARVSARMKGASIWLRGLSIREYPAKRNPLSGTVYSVMLGMFDAMPPLISGRATIDQE